MANLRERISIEAVDNTTRGLRSAQNKLNAFDRTLKRVQTTMLGFVGINIGIQLGRSLLKASDAAVELEAKLRLMTSGTEAFNVAQSELVKISKESGSSLESNIILFTRMNRAIQASGGSMQTTLGITRALAQGLRISGASAQESASVVRQFSQAMASGVLRGEEFNAIMENGGRIGLALAAGLDVPIGKLREMAKAGELTAQRVIAALLSQSEILQAENAKLPLTIGRAFQNVRTEWTLLLSTFTEGNSKFAQFINGLAQHVGALAGALSVAAKVGFLLFGVKAIQSVLKYGSSIAKTVKDVIKLSVQKQAAARQDAVNARLEEANARRSSRLQAEAIAATHAKAIASAQANVASAQATVLTEKNAVATTALTASTLKASIAEQQLANKKLANAVVTQRALVAEIKAELQLEAAMLKVQYTQKGRDASNQRAAVTKAKLVQADSALVKAEASLTIASDAVTASTARQNIALTANGAAKLRAKNATSALAASEAALAVAQKSNVASTVLVGTGLRKASKGASLFSRVMGNTGKNILPRLLVGLRGLGTALTGLPGLLLFLGGSILSEFVELDVIFRSVGLSLQKLYLILSNPIDFVFNTGDLQSKLDSATASYNKYIDDKIGIDDAEKARIVARDQDLIDELQATGTKIIENASKIADAENAINELRSDSFKSMIDSMESESDRLGVDNDAAIAAIKEESSIRELALRERFDNEVDFDKAFSELKDETDGKIQDQTLKFLDAEKLRWDAFYTAQIAGAKGNNRRQLSLEVERGNKLREINSSAVSELRSRLDKMRTDYANYAGKVAAIDDAIATNKQRVKDFLLEINGDVREDWQKDLDAQSARYDALKLIEDAALLNKETDAGKILELNKKAQSDLEALIRSEKIRKDAAKDGSVAQLTATTNINEALGAYKTASDAIITSQKQLQINEGSAQDKRIAAIKTTTDSLTSHLKLIAEIDSKLKGQRKLEITVDDNEVVRKLDALEKRLAKLNDTEVTLTVREETLTRVVDDIQKKALGGFIRRKDEVPGQGNGDTVKALLTPGEFIMRKSAVQKFGAATMHAMNNGVQKFATGGVVLDEDDPFQAFLSNITSGKKAANDASKKFIEQSKTTIAPETGERAVAGLIAQYTLRRDKHQRAIDNTSGALGYEQAAQLFHSRTWVKQMQSMIDSASSMSGKSSSEISKFARINGDIITMLRTIGRSRPSNKPGFDFQGALRDLIVQRNALSGGGSVPPLQTIGVHHASSNETKDLSTEQRAKNLKNAQKAGISEVLARNLTTRGIVIPEDKSELDKLVKKENIRKFALGGGVDGSGLGDTVKALLTPGEFVMRKSAVQSFGQDFFNTLNKGIMPQKFATGGSVGESNTTGETITVNFNVGNGVEAIGTFNKTDATMTMLETLRQSGAAA